MQASWESIMPGCSTENKFCREHILCQRLRRCRACCRRLGATATCAGPPSTLAPARVCVCVCVCVCVGTVVCVCVCVCVCVYMCVFVFYSARRVDRV
jgi:hypothetical protein